MRYQVLPLILVAVSGIVSLAHAQICGQLQKNPFANCQHVNVDCSTTEGMENGAQYKISFSYKRDPNLCIDGKAFGVLEWGKIIRLDANGTEKVINATPGHIQLPYGTSNPDFDEGPGEGLVPLVYVRIAQYPESDPNYMRNNLLMLMRVPEKPGDSMFARVGGHIRRPLNPGEQADDLTDIGSIASKNKAICKYTCN